MNLLKNRTVLGIICITLSLMICFVITPFFNKEMAQKTEIVRVTTAIQTGQAITTDMVTVMEVGGYNLPETVIKNTETVIGSYALADFSAGDYILAEKVSDSLQAENAYLYNLDGSQKAISITIPSLANGLSGKLQSGDIISIITPNFRDGGETIIPPELKYVEVISVTTKTGEDANQQSEPDREDESAALPSTVTLLVNDLQSRFIAELEFESDVHMALVFRGEKEDAQVFLDAQAAYLLQLEERDGYYLDEETGEWVEIPEGFYYDEATKKLMGLPDGFQYDKTSGTLVPVVNTDINSSLTMPDVVVTRPEEPTTDSEDKEEEKEEKEEESDVSESEKEGDDVTKPDESEGTA